MENLRLRHTASNGVDKQANDVKAEIIIHNKFGKSKFVWQALLSILVAYTIYLALVASPVDPQPFITNFTVPRFVGALTPNNKLQRVEKLFNGRILGPESIVKDNKGNYYTGLADGRIVKLFKNGSMEEIARTGNNNGTKFCDDSSWKWQDGIADMRYWKQLGRGEMVPNNLRTKKKKKLVDDAYNLKGPNAGQHTTFAENLPGYPANIRTSPTGGYWVGLIAVRKQPFSFLDMAGPYPFMRTLLAKMMSQQTMSMVIPSYGMILRLNEDGKIMESLHDPSGKIMDEIVDVYEDTEENVLILGSYKHNFLGRLPLQKVRI
eukprot:Seg659.8 transcript_id=Seg659.8/GoldUCD/mRNA.D3Y31 product="Adipocyte plasma membrane-associated protein" protein_id=Seg659.8/GoldUCD/D3Y31